MTQSKHPKTQTAELRTQRNELQSQLGEVTKTLVENGLMKRNINTSVDYLIDVAKNHDHLTKLSAELRTQRDAFYERLHEVTTGPYEGKPTLEELVEQVIQERARFLELANTHTEYDEGMRKAMQRIAVACGKKFGVDVGYETLPELVERVIQSRPVVHDKRYIVHGDIQPCVVLYSDETTTLVRLDETDIMCETSTIEWSDELTYRCQEMLRDEAKRSGGHVSLPTIKLVAQLVRDERILLNDNGADSCDRMTPKTCLVCAHVTDGTLDNCPQCHTPFGGSDDA